MIRGAIALGHELCVSLLNHPVATAVCVCVKIRAHAHALTD
jgi:hypothetical protein